MINLIKYFLKFLKTYIISYNAYPIIKINKKKINDLLLSLNSKNKKKRDFLHN